MNRNHVVIMMALATFGCPQQDTAQPAETESKQCGDPKADPAKNWCLAENCCQEGDCNGNGIARDDNVAGFPAKGEGLNDCVTPSMIQADGGTNNVTPDAGNGNGASSGGQNNSTNTNTGSTSHSAQSSSTSASVSSSTAASTSSGGVVYCNGDTTSYCEGTVVQWCDDSIRRTYDCARDGLVCGYVGFGSHDCVSAQGNSTSASNSTSSMNSTSSSGGTNNPDAGSVQVPYGHWLIAWPSQRYPGCTEIEGRGTPAGKDPADGRWEGTDVGFTYASAIPLAYQADVHAFVYCPAHDGIIEGNVYFADGSHLDLQTPCSLGFGGPYCSGSGPNNTFVKFTKVGTSITPGGTVTQNPPDAGMGTTSSSSSSGGGATCGATETSSHCVGDTAIWCDSGLTWVYDCRLDNLHCGYVGFGFHDCVTQPVQGSDGGVTTTTDGGTPMAPDAGNGTPPLGEIRSVVQCEKIANNEEVRKCTVTGLNRPDVWQADPYPNAADPGTPTHFLLRHETSCGTSSVAGYSCQGAGYDPNGGGVYSFAVPLGSHMRIAATNDTSQAVLWQNAVDTHMHLGYTDLPMNANGTANQATFYPSNSDRQSMLVQ